MPGETYYLGKEEPGLQLHWDEETGPGYRKVSEEQSETPHASLSGRSGMMGSRASEKPATRAHEPVMAHRVQEQHHVDYDALSRWAADQIQKQRAMNQALPSMPTAVQGSGGTPPPWLQNYMATQGR